MSEQRKPSWRDFYEVHPACAEWPALSPTQRDALKADLNVNKLKVPIQTREVAGDKTKYVIDGYHRLDLMEELGWQIIDENGEWMGAMLGKFEDRKGRTHEQIGEEVNSYNGKRRHMTKQALADAIVATLVKVREMTGTTDLGKTRRSAKRDTGKDDLRKTRRSFSPTPGKRGGSTKDELKATATKQAEEAGSSKHAIQRALAKTTPAAPHKQQQPETHKLLNGKDAADVFDPKTFGALVLKYLKPLLKNLLKHFDPKRENEMKRVIVNNWLSLYHTKEKRDMVPELIYPDGTKFSVEQVLSDLPPRLDTDKREKLKPKVSHDITAAVGHAPEKD